MRSDELSRVEGVFQRAADLAPAARAAYLDEACAGDPGLRGRVEAMLARLDAGESLGVAVDFEVPAGAPGPGGVAGEGEASDVPAEGEVVGRYKLLEKIGEGGYGVVYMAQQLEPVERRVAFKVVKLGMDTREVVARFEAERQALALMEHPGIAKVLDAGATDAGRPYFVMELVRGVSITTYCEENGLSTSARLELFRDVCLAVHHAHQKGVIHRDIKPSNVMVSLHDGKPLIKVIDFGIAKAMHARLTNKTLFTGYNRFIGTPAYMSPEQAEMSTLDIDTRSDIYSLGVLLYELLTGTTPFGTRELLQAGLSEIQRVIREVEPERPSVRVSTSSRASFRGPAGSKAGGEAQQERVRRLRGDLDWIVMKALEKDRTRRYASASELAEDARRHLEHEPVEAGPPNRIYRMRKLLKKHRSAVTWLTVVILALLGGIVGTTVGLIEAGAQRDQAEEAAQGARRVTDFLVRTLALTDPEISLVPDLSVVQLLDRASARVADELGGEPRAEARARLAIGRAYESLGRPELAHAHLGRAISLAEELPDYDPAELYTALWRMTHVLFVLERPEALSVAQRARRVAHEHVGEQHAELAQALERFVRMADEVTHEPSAEGVASLRPLFEDSVRLSEESLSVGDPLWLIVADSYQHAAYDLWFSPIEVESVRFWERALEIQRRELSVGHPELARTLMQLTGVLNRCGRLADAEKHIRESVALVRRAYPTGSFKAAVAEAALGENLTLQGRYAEAQELLLASHAAILRTAESSTFFAADSFRRVIALYAAWGRETEASRFREPFARFSAEGLYVQPFEIAISIFGPDEAALREVFGELRAVCGDIAYPVEPGRASAPTLLVRVRQLVQQRRALFADDDPRAIVVGRYLLHWSNQVDPVAEAEARAAMLEEALRLVPQVRETAPLDVAEVFVQSAAIAAAGGDAVRAGELGAEALSALGVATAADAWYGAAARVRIARRLVSLERFAEAEELLLSAFQVFLDQLGSEHSKTGAARALAKELYTAWGRPERFERLDALEADL